MSNNISPLAHVDKSAQIGDNVTIHPFAYVEGNTVIGDGTEVMPYVSILSGSRIGKDNKFYQGAIIGAVPQDFGFKPQETIVEIGDRNVVREYSVITRSSYADGATRIGDDNFIMQAARLSHDAHVGNACIVGNAAQISGNTQIDDHAILCSGVLMQQGTHVGEWSFVQGGCRFGKDIPPYIIAALEPIRYHGVNHTVMLKNGFDEKVIKHITSAYRLVFQGQTTNMEEVCSQIKDQIPGSAEIDKVVDFLLRSEIGVI